MAWSEADGPGSGASRLRIREVVIDCADHEVVVPFWAAALGWQPQRVNEQYVALQPPDGDPGPAILFQKVPERKQVKNRVHLDLGAAVMADAVARLVGLGAAVVAERALGDFRWTVMTDPEGNELCVAEG
jgi:predicted enzyme related to lactoylglutathione lyase